MSNWVHLMPTTEAYLLGQVFYRVHHNADELEAYRQDPDEYLSRYPLTAKLLTAIRENDVATMYRTGVNPYLLRALCIGVGIPEDVSLAALRSVADEEQQNG